MTSDGQPGRGAPRLRVAAPEAQSFETSVFEYAAGNAPSLVVLDGPLAGKEIPVGKKVLTIGRDATADVVLPDLEVSSRHAEIIREGQRYTLRDAGSKNGVEFRGQLIDEVPLADGDEFSICRSRFRFSAAPAQSDLLAQREHTEVTEAPTAPKRRRRRRLVALAAAAITLGGVWWWLSRGSSPAVTVAVAQVKALQQETTFSGRLVPRSDVRLFASVSAPVVKIHASEGQLVKKGDPIVALDPEILGMALDKAKAQVQAAQAAVRAAEAAMRQAERKHKEDQSLLRKGIVSRAEVDTAAGVVNSRRSEVSAARAELSRAEVALAQSRRDHQDTMVRAPIDGQVTTINIKVGEAPRDLAGVPIATIEDASELLAEIAASEAKIGLLRPGQPAKVRVSGIGLGTELTGKVMQIAPKAEQPAALEDATRYTAKVALEGKDERLRAGMQVQVRIITAEKAAALTVPLLAMVTGGRASRGVAEQVAVVEENGGVRWLNVETDLISADEVEIVSGLNAGQRVITGPVEVLLKLKDGQTVTVR